MRESSSNKQYFAKLGTDGFSLVIFGAEASDSEEFYKMYKLIKGNIMAEPYIGEIRAVAFNYAPRNWAMCDGQLLDINQNQSLYALIGNTYGGDGRSTFAMPDLRGRIPLHSGTGPGLRNILRGEKGGSERIQLDIVNIPSHTHTASLKNIVLDTEFKTTVSVKADSGIGNQDFAEGNYWSTASKNGGINGEIPIPNSYSSEATKFLTNMAEDAVVVDVTGTSIASGGSVNIDNFGSGEAFYNRQPYIGMNYIIALEGIFPPRH
jgi:microcystin-dependent protein